MFTSAFRGGLVLLVPLVLLTALGVGLLDRMIFQPSRGPGTSPEQLGIAAESVEISAEDGERIHAYFLPASSDPLALLFLHGNAGQASDRLPNAAELARLGLPVLLLDYRGYGQSQGSPSERGVYLDARAGLAHLAERGYPSERVVVFGRSLGGAVAVELAQGRRLAGLILESTFSSVRDMARSSVGFGFGPLLAGRFPSLDRIGRVQCPILFFHGDRDRIVPIELGRKLFERAPEPKSFEVIRGAGHNDTVPVGGRPYFQRIAAFVGSLEAGEAP